MPLSGQLLISKVSEVVIPLTSEEKKALGIPALVDINLLSEMVGGPPLVLIDSFLY